MRLRIGYAVVGVTYIATIASILGGCQPFHHNWQIFPDPGSVFSSSLLQFVMLTRLQTIVNLPFHALICTSRWSSTSCPTHICSRSHCR